jgi:hypothetical protein
VLAPGRLAAVTGACCCTSKPAISKALWVARIAPAQRAHRPGRPAAHLHWPDCCTSHNHGRHVACPVPGICNGVSNAEKRGQEGVATVGGAGRCLSQANEWHVGNCHHRALVRRHRQHTITKAGLERRGEAQRHHHRSKPPPAGPRHTMPITAAQRCRCHVGGPMSVVKAHRLPPAGLPPRCRRAVPAPCASQQQQKQQQQEGQPTEPKPMTVLPSSTQVNPLFDSLGAPLRAPFPCPPHMHLSFPPNCSRGCLPPSHLMQQHLQPQDWALGAWWLWPAPPLHQS